MTPSDSSRRPAGAAKQTSRPTTGPRPAAETLDAAAQSKAESALGWDDADLDSPEFRELGAPESSALLTADVEAALDDVGAAAGPGSASREPKLPPVEWALVSVVNGLWAVLGPILWLPVLIREVLVALLETAHGALTGQQSPKARRRLREASRFVSGRFLDRSGQSAQKSLRRQAKLFRLLFELAWSAAAYAVLFHALGWVELPWRAASNGVAEGAVELWRSQMVPLPGRVSAWLSSTIERAPAVLRQLLDLPPLALGALAGGALLLALFGFWLGSRRR